MWGTLPGKLEDPCELEYPEDLEDVIHASGVLQVLLHPRGVGEEDRVPR